MKLKNDTDLAQLLRKAKLCKGEVYFKTTEGDVLNLKSLFSTLILQTISQDSTILSNGMILCMEAEDEQYFQEFTLSNP